MYSLIYLRIYDFASVRRAAIEDAIWSISSSAPQVCWGHG